MQHLGVRVAPYINGRIFDQGTESWKKSEEARGSAAKQVATPVINPSGDALYNESYGSEALFAVMCPATQYWQKTISDVVKRLITEYETDGVYIDQIAAAGPEPCFDASHGHPIGGGSHWVSGYRKMLETVRSFAEMIKCCSQNQTRSRLWKVSTST